MGTSLQNKARYERNKTKGICVRCVKKPAKVGGVLCEACPDRERKRVKTYRDDHLAEIRAKKLAYSRTLQGRFACYKNDAKRFGREFSLTLDEFADLWQQPCSYCGVSIKTIGIDRIDNSKGYVFDNVRPCCGRCNKMRNNMTVEEFVAHILKIADRIGRGLVP